MMNRITCFLFFFAMIGMQINSFAQSDVNKDWHTYKSEERAYSISFPKEPSETKQTVPSDIGELELEIIMCDVSMEGDDNLIYMVNYTAYPEGTVHSKMEDMHDQFFRGAVDGAVSNVGGKLISEKPIALQGYPGREAKVDFMNGANVITFRCYLVENAMYITQSICETSKDDNANMKIFFDSFSLTLD